MRRPAAMVLLMTAACAGAPWKSAPHDKPFQRIPDPVLHPIPARMVQSDWWYSIINSGVRKLGELLSPGHYVETYTGKGREALDVNAFGQVLDSPWFTNRISKGGLTPALAALGPNSLAGPSPGPLLVLGGKVEGATPGLVVRDDGGHQFIVKFDPPAFPEMSSAAEVISAKVLHAAGYNVPENYMVELEIQRLVLSPDATTSGEYGERIPLTADGLLAVLSHVNPYSDGTVRATFSRVIPGTPLGNFDYRGRRRDDPNDTVPHERRRSLRGLWVFNAWLNNTDPTMANTLDVFVEAPPGSGSGLGYVKHYLLDFGDALGASGTKPKYAGKGYEGDLDWPAIHQAVFSFGMYYSYWLPVLRSPFRSVGIYEADVFEADRWRPNIPNPAFDAATALDTYWAASIVSRFTPDHLLEIVRTARYTEPGAAEWVLRVLAERQFKIVSHAFQRVLALDDPRVEAKTRLLLIDLEHEASMLYDANTLSYEWSARWNRTGASDVELGSGMAPAPAVELGELVARVAPGDPFVSVRFTRPRGPGDPGPSVDVHLRVAGDRLLVVGLDREVD